MGIGAFLTTVAIIVFILTFFKRFKLYKHNKRLRIAAVVLFFMGALIGGTNEPSVPTQTASIKTANPIQFQIISLKHYDYATRKRISIHIVPDRMPKNSNEIGATIKNALLAISITHPNDAYLLFMEISKKTTGIGMQLGTGGYFPDGKGWSGDKNSTWNIEAVRKVPTNKQLKIFTAVNTEYDNPIYKGIPTTVKNERMFNAVAKRFNVTPKQVNNIFNDTSDMINNTITWYKK